MKLGEKRNRRNRQLRPIELLTPAVETDGRFDPEVHITEEDWRLSSTGDLSNKELLSLWEAQLYLNPEKFKQSRQDAEQRQTVSLTYGSLIERTKDEGVFFRRLELALAMRDLFPEEQTNEHFSEDVQHLKARLDELRQLQSPGKKIKEIIKILYLIKRNPETGITHDLTLESEEWKALQDWWNEVWVAGHLEDIAPEELVELMAKIRVVDPKRFEEITLDQKFWNLALDWLKALRTEAGTRYVFIFSFYLHLLAADSVEVDPDGKLRIQNSSAGELKKPTPLPERNAVA